MLLGENSWLPNLCDFISHFSEFSLSASDDLADRQGIINCSLQSHDIFLSSVFMFGLSCLTCIDTSCVVVPLLSYYLVGVTVTCVILLFVIITEVSTTENLITVMIVSLGYHSWQHYLYEKWIGLSKVLFRITRRSILGSVCTTK